MTTCQTAANEFLRQFWLAIYPPANESQQLSVATPAQKAAKASKMIGYLKKTHEKVEALVVEAQREQVDPARVRVVSELHCLRDASVGWLMLFLPSILQAMKPILDAVDKALGFWQTKNAKTLGAR